MASGTKGGTVMAETLNQRFDKPYPHSPRPMPFYGPSKFCKMKGYNDLRVLQSPRKGGLKFAMAPSCHPGMRSGCG